MTVSPGSAFWVSMSAVCKIAAVPTYTYNELRVVLEYTNATNDDLMIRSMSSRNSKAEEANKRQYESETHVEREMCVCPRYYVELG